jgi:trk system potassium uptake protein TrkA
MRKQVVVVGLGRLGDSLVKTLMTIGHEVLALDSDEKLVQAISPFVTQAVQVDTSNESALKELGVGNFDIGIVVMPEIEISVISTIVLQKLGVRYIMARASSTLHGAILEKLGVNKVFYPDRDMGAGIAYVLTLGDIIDYIPVTTGYGVVKMTVPSDFVGKTISEVGFGYHGILNVVALLLQRKDEILVNPSPSENIRTEDVLVVAGNWDKLEDLFARVKKVT